MATRKKSLIDDEIIAEELAPKKKSAPKKEKVEAIPVEFLEHTGMLVNTEHRAETTVDLFGKTKTELSRKTGEVLMSKERKELIEATRTAVARQQARSLELLVRVRDDETQPMKLRIDAAKNILDRGIGNTPLIVDETNNDISVSFDEGIKDLGV